MKEYNVAVFPTLGKRGLKCHAYTLWYNPEWSGCNMVKVEASSGTEAKKRAIAVIKLRYKTDPKSVKFKRDFTEYQ